MSQNNGTRPHRLSRRTPETYHQFQYQCNEPEAPSAKGLVNVNLTSPAWLLSIDTNQEVLFPGQYQEISGRVSRQAVAGGQELSCSLPTPNL
jgi:hypothetical protein